MFQRLVPVLVAFIVVVGIILRFLPRTALWLDEALSVNIAGLPIGDIPGALRQDGHPPLYYVLLHFWMNVFGDSDWTVRALSGVVSTLTIPATYVAARRLATRPRSELGDPRRVGLLAMAIVAVMPFAVRYGAEARMYALVMLFATLGYPIVTNLLEDPGEPSDPMEPGRAGGSEARRFGNRAWTIVAATLLSAALLWTHYWSVWLLGAVGIVTVVTIWSRRRRSDRRQALRGPIDLLVALVIGGLLFTPWLPTMLYQAEHTGTPWGEQFGPFAAVVTTLVDFAGGRFGAAQFLSYILVTLIVAAAAISVRATVNADGGSAVSSKSVGRIGTVTEPDYVVTGRIVPRIRAELWVTALTLGIGLLTAFVSGNTYSARYGAVFFPLFILTLAAGTALMRRSVSTVLVMSVIAVLCLYGSLGSARADRTQVGSLVDSIEEDIAQQPNGGPVVIVTCPDQLGVATQRQVDQRPELHALTADVVTFPRSKDPHFVDWVDYADRNAAASPEDFVHQLDASIGQQTTVYLISSPHYRTLEGKCEAVSEELSAGRVQMSLGTLDTSGLDEAAELRVFRPQS